MKENTKLALKSVLASLIALILILVVFWEYNRGLGTTLKQDARESLSNNAAQNMQVVESKLSDHFSFLESIAGAIASYGGADSRVMYLLHSFSNQGPLVRLAVADVAGNVQTGDGETCYIGDRDYFRRVTEGEQRVSDIETSAVDGVQTLILAVPLYSAQGTLVGVLRSDYHLPVFTEIMGESPFDGKGSLHLVLQDGTGIMYTGPFADQDYFSILTQAELTSGETFASLQEKLAQGQSGILEYTYQGQRQYMVYQPLSVQQWYLFETVPADVIDHQTGQLAKIGLALLIKVMAVFILLSIFLSISQRRYILSSLNHERRINTLTQNIPGSVQSCLNDVDFTLVCASDELYHMIGYTRQELYDKLHNRFAELIEPEDLERVQAEIARQLELSHRFEVEYRLRKKNGGLLWVLDKGQRIVPRSGIETLYSVLVDITASKEAQMDLAISEERHRIVSEQSDNIIYEYRAKDQTLYCTSRFEKKFGYLPVTENIPACLRTSGILHEHDTQVFFETCGQLSRSSPHQSCEVRIKKADGSYLWCTIQMTAICDEKSRIVRVVGRIKDIHERKRRTERLERRAQKDSLTGLYNKETAEKKIDEILGVNRAGSHAVFVIDIDNFKAINDSLGHLCGDEVLRQVSKTITEAFGSSGIAARFGGDEFVVFCENAGSDDEIVRKAKMLCSSFHRPVAGDHGKVYHISGSVGVAVSPRDGNCFNALFEKADRALYCAKSGGKNRFEIYGTPDADDDTK